MLSIVQTIVFTLALKWVRAEVFTAMADVEPLLATHRSVIHSLESYLDEENKRLEGLKKYLIHYKNEHKKMEEESDYIGNPVNSFTLIKRLTADLDFIESFVNFRNAFNKQPEALFPTSEDLEGAVMALSRLQTTYDLNATQLADGKLYGTFSHGRKPFEEQTSPMSATDCFEIGRVMCDNKEYGNAVQWLLLALQKFKHQPQEFINFSEANLVDYIRYAYHGLNDTKNAVIWTKKLLTLRPDDAEAARLADLEKQITQQDFKKDADVTNLEQPLRQNKSTASGILVHGSQEFIQVYRELCRGDRPLPHDKAKSLHCYYKTGPESFLFLARIKTELLYLEPTVLMFYDVISDAEIDTIRTLARPTFQRATVAGGVDGQPIAASYRISKTSWLKDEHSPVVARVSQRVADFTELSVLTAESLQVANYGIGGYYEPHYDFSKIPDVRVGHRIATILFYMSDVEQGGATVFIDLNLTVFPVKNSAIFWFNLHASGDVDYRTKHAACPVLRGSKWASNKWLHHVDQEFHRPCNLRHENETCN